RLCHDNSPRSIAGEHDCVEKTGRKGGTENLGRTKPDKFTVVQNFPVGSAHTEGPDTMFDICFHGLLPDIRDRICKPSGKGAVLDLSFPDFDNPAVADNDAAPADSLDDMFIFVCHSRTPVQIM